VNYPFNVCVNDTVQLLLYIFIFSCLAYDFIDHLSLITAVIVGCQCITMERNKY